MYWALIAAGVTAGLGLVIAKQWFDRREEREVTGRDRAVKSASAHGADLHQEEPPKATEATPETEKAASSEPSTGAGSQDVDDTRQVDEALASGDLAEMEKVLQETDDPIDRNRLLGRLVAGHYRQRAEPEHLEAFYRAAHTQIEEASVILDAIEAMGRPRPDHLEAFKVMAIALDEDERYDEAVAICEKALSLGLEDGTKTGFEGRIARLTRSRDVED